MRVGIVFAAVIVMGSSSAVAQGASAVEHSYGLRVSDDGTVELEGKPFRGYGVNYYSAFARCLEDPADTSYREGFAELARLGIPFARLRAGGFFPDNWSLYLNNKEEYFRLFDGVVKAAEETGVGLIPSLFWYTADVPDLAGEPRNAWGNPDSKTIAFMRTYVDDVVRRYVHSPAIWAWEFGNEYDLAADLPNAADHRPWVNEQRGTPPARSEQDDLRFDLIVSAFREFATAVRSIDPYRAITTGNSLPRPTAYHQRTILQWVADSREDFARQLVDSTPDPCDLMSVHVYTQDHAKRFQQSHTSYDELLELAMKAARSERKALFVGEWGAKDGEEGAPRDFARRENFELITALDRQQVPLAALWVYDFPKQEAEHNVTTVNDRKYLLRALELANHRIRVCDEAVRSVPLAGGGFQGALLDFVANKGRSGNGFNPLQHGMYRGENLFRDDATGLYFEHIFNGAKADHGISMFTPNNDLHTVQRLSEHSAVMIHPAEASSWGMGSRMAYVLTENAVDMTFEATPTRDQYPFGFAAFMWASYMNHTRDRRIHFYGTNGGEEGWLSFGEDTTEKPEGFETGTVAYEGVEFLPYEEGAQLLNLVEHPTKRFLLPFYYGLVDGDGFEETTDDTMAYIMMFDQKETIRFALWNFIKNAAGDRDTHSPAWDWQFVIHDPKPGQTYGYRARVMYVPFTGAENVRERYEAWAASLP